MTNIHRVAAAVIGLAVIGAVPASAQQPGAEAGAIVATGPGVAEVNRVTVIADVVAVNACTQTVTLRGVEYAVDLHVPDKSQFAAIRSHGAPARTRNAAAPLRLG
jgi:hypothetical protein